MSSVIDPQPLTIGLSGGSLGCVWFMNFEQFLELPGLFSLAAIDWLHVR